MARCKVPVCTHEVLAKGLCNGHYLRMKRGKSLKTEITSRGGICKICSKPNYGLGLCKRHYGTLRSLLIKQLLVENAGGRCEDCKRKYPPSVFDFHHLNPLNKKFTLGSELQNKSFKTLINEASKCIMLCANCHRLRHFHRKEKKWPDLKRLLIISSKMREDWLTMKTTRVE